MLEPDCAGVSVLEAAGLGVEEVTDVVEDVADVVGSVAVVVVSEEDAAVVVGSVAEVVVVGVIDVVDDSDVAAGLTVIGTSIFTEPAVTTALPDLAPSGPSYRSPRQELQRRFLFQ